MVIPESYLSINVRVWASVISFISYFIIFYFLITFVGPGIISSYLILSLILSISITRLLAPILCIIGFYLNVLLLNFTGYDPNEYTIPLLIALFIFCIISYIIPTLIYKWQKSKEEKRRLLEINQIYVNALKSSKSITDVQSVCRRCNNLQLFDNSWMTLVEYTEKHSLDKINITICPNCINKIKKEK